ncbi:putative spermidine/putrescine transport system substrate-binding protein [Actinomadura pelletieri DSM 43383]|uniref:Putative spermidine/putrescine transport system substrate-binding protein n=1 Tax=Actinomadura pelletieri DSM 43383 TaxID=1120940 RepID=A0A495QTU3_9ACTN|nr:extracellular solute-binding protein [Actinomadura pelletieri]RKS76940.1 putative spermidine/putrescine transport system substrate-binding protein [Actinomadura pelletieri DSM 43383]
MGRRIGKTGPTARFAAAGLAVSLVATACSIGNASDDEGDTLTYVSTGPPFQDAQAEAWQKPFTADSGVKFRNDSPVDEAKMVTMVEAKKVTWDLVDTTPAVAVQYCGKYVEKLDFSVIDKSKYPQGTVNDCGVPNFFYSTFVMYNTKKYANSPPTSMAAFFDVKKYPGKRIVPPEISVGLLEAALLADGVQPNQLYPLDLDRAFKQLDKIKSVTTFAKTYGQMQQMMVDQQFDMGLMLNVRAYQGLKAGAPYKGIWDKSIVNWNVFVVPKGSKNKEQAMKFIASTAGDEPSKKIAESASVLPVNKDLQLNLDQFQQQVYVYAPERRGGIVHADAQWWGQNFDQVTKRYTQWLSG